MAILSNLDIEQEMNSGRIKIEPKPPDIGPISIDLTIDEVSELDVGPNPKRMFETLYQAKTPEPYTVEDVEDVVQWKTKPLEPVNDSWLFKRFHWYLVKYRERVRVADLEVDIVARSTTARRGLYPLAVSMRDGTIIEIIVPYISNFIKNGDKLSQIVFREPYTRYLTGWEYGKLTVEDFSSVHDGRRAKYGLIAAIPGTTKQELEERLKIDEANIGLTLHPVVKYFRD